MELFLLRKLGGRWQIISKTATRLSAGNSYSQLIHAYDRFLEAG